MNIKKVRLEKKLSQKEVAQALSVSQPTVCDWEAGRKSPTRTNLEKLAAYLDCSVDYLLFGDAEEHRASDRDVKLTLFGTPDVDDELYEEVKRFARYAWHKKYNDDRF